MTNKFVDIRMFANSVDLQLQNNPEKICTLLVELGGVNPEAVVYKGTSIKIRGTGIWIQTNGTQDVHKHCIFWNDYSNADASRMWFNNIIGLLRYLNKDNPEWATKTPWMVLEEIENIMKLETAPF